MVTKDDKKDKSLQFAELQIWVVRCVWRQPKRRIEGGGDTFRRAYMTSPAEG